MTHTRLHIKNSFVSILGRMIVYGVLFLAQIALILLVGRFFSEHQDALQIGVFTLDALVGLHIVNDKRNDSVYKVAFLFTIIVLPVFGAFLYMASKRDVLRRWFSDKFETTK